MYTKKMQVTSGMLHRGIPRETNAELLYPMPKSSENLWKFSEELGNLWEFPNTLEALQTPFSEELKLNDL